MVATPRCGPCPKLAQAESETAEHVQFDLLPKGCHAPDVVDWLQGLAARKKVNSISTHVVSSRSKLGLADAANSILRERRGRDVYVMGAANVGKSAFIRCALSVRSVLRGHMAILAMMSLV